MEGNTSAWNSLEVAKLIVSIITPVAIVFIGFWIQSTLAKQNQTWKARERLADRRLMIYDDIRDELNRIYCFIEDVGTWKEEDPDKVISYKRKLDQVMHTQQAIWAPDTFSAYQEYMDAAFATYQGVGEDAKIETKLYEKEKGIKDWKPAWSDRLTDKKDPSHKSKYKTLINLISRDLMLMESGS